MPTARQGRAREGSATMNRLKAFATLLGIEFKLNVRDMNMVVFAIVMPLVVLVVLGIVYGSAPAFEGAGYTFVEQSFGAVASIAICAAGAMGLPLAVADYRERKVFKRMKATPASPALILGVNVAIYALYAAISLALLWAVSSLAFGVQMRGSWLAFLGGWLLTLASMLSIGLVVGGLARTSKQASVIASVLYFPMLVFSGATLPFEIMPEAVRHVAGVMPLTQGIQLMKSAFLGAPIEAAVVPLVALAALVAVCTAAAVRFFRWE